MGKIENMTYEEKVKNFNIKYGYRNQSNRNRLRELADKNRNLVDKYILGKPKNPFYTPRNTSPITPRDNEYYALIQWTIPREKYDYKIVSYEEFCKDKNIFRSSFIPFVRKDGVNYWLLGSFHDYQNTKNPILADFGGGCEKKDEKDEKENCFGIKCAMRELYEESNNVLPEFVDKSIEEGNFVTYRGISKNGYRIYFTFVELDYDIALNTIEYFKYAEPVGKEIFGNIGLYPQKDIKSGKYRTSKNLTDLLSYLRRLY